MKMDIKKKRWRIHEEGLRVGETGRDIRKGRLRRRELEEY